METGAGVQSSTLYINHNLGLIIPGYILAAKGEVMFCVDTTKVSTL